MLSFARFRFATVVLAGLLGAQCAALACPHNTQMFMCPGDPVVDPTGDSGVVRAINPFQGTVSVYEAQHGQNYQYDIKQVALGLGCLEGYCVGDAAVDPTGDGGSVAAVNPYTRQITIYEPQHGRNYIYGIDQIALGLGCMQGYCVGDGVVDATGDNGVIAGINRATGQIAIYEARHGRNYIYDIRTVSSTQFCATYGERERSVALYPEFQVDMYISTEVHFSLTRPIR